MKRTPSTASPKLEEKEDDAGVVSAVLSAEEEAELAALQAREARGGAEALASELGAALQAQERALVEAIIERSQEVQQLQDQLSQIPVILAPLHQQLAEHQAQLKALALKAHEADIRADKRLLLAQNLQRLSDQLADLLQRLDLPQSIRQTLESGGLEMEKDLESAWGAVEALEAKEKSLRELPPAMLQMKAVSDHLECIAQLRTNFASRLQKALLSRVEAEARRLPGKPDASGGELALQEPERMHAALRPFLRLSRWQLQLAPSKDRPALERAYLEQLARPVYRLCARRLCVALRQATTRPAMAEPHLLTMEVGTMPPAPVPAGPTAAFLAALDSALSIAGRALPGSLLPLDPARAFMWALRAVRAALQREATFVADLLACEPAHAARLLDSFGISSELEALTGQALNEASTSPAFLLPSLAELDLRAEADTSEISSSPAAALTLGLLTRAKQSLNAWIDAQVSFLQSLKAGGTGPAAGKLPLWLGYLDRVAAWHGAPLALRICHYAESAALKVVIGLAAWIEAQAPSARKERKRAIFRLTQLRAVADALESRASAANSPLSSYATQAEQAARQALESYGSALLAEQLERRLFSFFNGVEELLTSRSAAEVPFHTAHSRQALQAVLQANSWPELERRLLAIRRRILKDAGRDPACVEIAWQEVARQLLARLRRAEELIELCYSGTRLPFSLADLERFFSRPPVL